ncbi:glycosyltransferase [Polluticaenibacter yanchengensis]|uniref:Glycosyltransferase n=1 Tax=Polluticaenibacter yanchengensis TaxID=3014562 RepID=A0ABT4UMF8_9BACT|nr:glycosyltransferase [Chitinophagaceae bacterium LY-5]
MWIHFISYCFLSIYTALILWYAYNWFKIKQPVVRNTVLSTPVTIIIPARNEAENIAACLESIIKQSFPSDLMEVLVINDASTDNTAEIAETYTQTHNYIKHYLLNLDGNEKAHKKRAIEFGVGIAKHPLIVCTDADCSHHENWLKNIVVIYETGNYQFIAAPVMFNTNSKVSSIFQTLDFLTLQGITGASVNANFHSMCNGANIAYTKAAFLKVNGFNGIDDLPTGDDMLLMHKIAMAYPGQTTWIKNKETITYTDAMPTWRSFFNQRIRWASKATYYSDKSIIAVLFLVYFFNVWLAVLPVLAIFNTQYWSLWFSIAGIKILVEYVFIIPVAAFFNKQNWLWTFPFFQPIHILYTVISGWLGKFGQYEWKGRKIHKS